MATHLVPEAEKPQRPVVVTTRIQRILDNQHILFINCKFIFTKLPIAPPVVSLVSNTTPADGNNSQTSRSGGEQRQPRKKRKFLTKMIKNAKEMLDELTNGGPESRAEERFQNCLIQSTNISKQALEEQIETYESTGHVQYSFSHCSFLQRESNFIEKLGIKIRRFVGVMFEVNYLTGTINVKEYALKLKDLPSWSVEIAEQIIEKEK